MLAVSFACLWCAVGCKKPAAVEPTLPDPTGRTWAAAVDNPFFPLPVGATWAYEAMNGAVLERDDVEVLPDVRVVSGVTATVVYDLVTVNAAVVEETWDWFAQDSDGNVWYLGEDTCEYEMGACTVMTGSWEWGVGGALPGIIMPAVPAVDGQPYYQEYLVGEAEDVGEVIGLGESITVPAGDFTDCVRTHDTSTLDPGIDEYKVYCRGFGLVFTDEPEADAALVSYAGL